MAAMLSGRGGRWSFRLGRGIYFRTLAGDCFGGRNGRPARPDFGWRVEKLMVIVVTKLDAVHTNPLKLKTRQTDAMEFVSRVP